MIEFCPYCRHIYEIDEMIEPGTCSCKIVGCDDNRSHSTDYHKCTRCDKHIENVELKSKL